MPEVKIEFAASPADHASLAEILGVPDHEVEKALAAYASAALEEYVTMFLGKKVFRRGTDLQEYRLFLLVLHVYRNRIPDDQEVSRLFQTTASESRALVRSVMSKYQYQLRQIVDSSLAALCAAAASEEEGGDFFVVVNSGNTVEELNRILAGIDGSLPPILKRRGSVSTYQIKPSAHAALVSHFGSGPSVLGS